MTKQVDIDLGVDDKSVVITFDNPAPRTPGLGYRYRTHGGMHV